MLKKTYCFKYQSYFCHFGAKPSIQEYDTLEEAKHYQALNMRVNDDAYIGNIFVKETVVITAEDLEKRAQRKAAKQIKVEPQWNAVYHFWDGTTEVVYVDDDFNIFFRSTKTWAKMDYLQEGEYVNIFDRTTGRRYFTWEGDRNPVKRIIEYAIKLAGFHRFSALNVFH